MPNTQKNKNKNKKGFTLLETLVAIAIMSLAVSAAFGMAQKSLSASYLARNQTIGYFLSAEGLELARAVRDKTALASINAGTDNNNWLSEFNGYCIGTGNKCDIDPVTLTTKVCSTVDLVKRCAISIKAIVSPGPSIYTSADNGGVKTVFYRAIHVIPNGNSAVVVSTVTWHNQTLTLTDTLTNWHK